MIPTLALKKLWAFHNDPKIKEKYLARVKAHEEADEIVKGVYWEKGKGCAVGCTIEGDNHKLYEKELGIPEAIAHLEDFLFEKISNGNAKTFPRRFLEAISVGAKLYLVAPKFIVFVLYDVLQYCGSDENCKNAIIQTVKLWESVVQGKVPKKAAWSAAMSAGTMICSWDSGYMKVRASWSCMMTV